MGLLPLLEEVDSTPLVLLCPVLVGLFPCWRALCKGKKNKGCWGLSHFLKEKRARTVTRHLVSSTNPHSTVQTVGIS